MKELDEDKLEKRSRHASKDSVGSNEEIKRITGAGSANNLSSIVLMENNLLGNRKDLEKCKHFLIYKI